MPFKIPHRSYFWLRIISVVILIVGLIQILRVNSPAPVAEKPIPVQYTSGTVVEGSVEIPAASFLSYEIKLNKKAKLKGKFTTEKLKGSIGCLVLNSENFARWRDGSEFQTVAKTGTVPGGNVNTRLEPGDYYLVLDNRHSASQTQLANVDFSVE